MSSQLDAPRASVTQWIGTMSRFRRAVVLFIVCLIAALPLPGYGQAVPEKKEPLSEWSRQWLEEVVPYIITDAEKSFFLSLPNEAERGKFIQNFWDKRDPNSQTPENEFKLAYYRRIAQANKRFGSESIAGWRTDRGRIYILLGPPHDIQRVFNETSDFSAQSVSKEIWDYWNLPNPRLPYNMQFVFVDTLNTGNFRLETGMAPTAGGGQVLDIGSMSTAFDQWELLAEAEKSPFADARKLEELITTQVTYDLIPLEYETLCFKGTGGLDYAPFTIEIPVSKLSPKRIDNRDHFSLTVTIGLSDPRGRSVVQRSRQVNFDTPPGEIERLESPVRRIEMGLEWEPGDYDLRLLVLDNFSGKIGTSRRPLSLVRYAGPGLALSDVVLSQESERPAGTERAASPSRSSRPPAGVARIFRPDRNLDIYFEIYNAALDPATGLNRLTVDYIVLQEGRALAQVPAPDIKPSGESDSRAETSLKLKNFKPGEYALQIRVTDATANNSVSRETKFRIVGAPGR
jgi:GWxTD domain-containing protein